MATKGLPGRINIVVLEAKLLACLLHNGRYATVVRLDDSGEEMMSCLVVEGTSEYCPEPAVCRIVLCCRHLHLCPVCVCVCVGGGGVYIAIKYCSRWGEGQHTTWCLIPRPGRRSGNEARIRVAKVTNQSMCTILSLSGLGHSTCVCVQGDFGQYRMYYCYHGYKIATCQDYDLTVYHVDRQVTQERYT